MKYHLKKKKKTYRCKCFASFDDFQLDQFRRSLTTEVFLSCNLCVVTISFCERDDAILLCTIFNFNLVKWVLTYSNKVIWLVTLTISFIIHRLHQLGIHIFITIQYNYIFCYNFIRENFFLLFIAIVQRRRSIYLKLTPNSSFLCAIRRQKKSIHFRSNLTVWISEYLQQRELKRALIRSRMIHQREESHLPKSYIVKWFWSGIKKKRNQ